MSDSTTALALIPTSFGEVTSLAESLSKSALLPKALIGKVPEVMMTIMAGAELGLPPIAALRSIHVIEGKTVISADGMVAIALARGAALYVKRISASDNEATYETLRRGETQPQRLTWTWEMARAAGLNTKDNWRLFKRQMLSSRAKAELMRDVYPDVLAGCYTTEEAEDFDGGRMPTINYGAPPAEIIDADIVTVDQPTTAPIGGAIEQIAGDLIARIYVATTSDDLKALSIEADKLPKKTAERKAVIAALKAQGDKVRLSQLEQPAVETVEVEVVAS